MRHRKLSIMRTSAVLALTSALLIQGNAIAYESDVHTFSINDVMGGFDGSTFGTAGALTDKSIICNAPGATALCPADGPQPFPDRDGTMLYPVDSAFGFFPVDFLGAIGKERDGIYTEGFVGNIVDAGEVIGLKVSNAETDTYKVKAPTGTWCRGLGGNSVKCETEHYSVMEHILSCHEVIPYKFADPDSGEQAILSFPDGSGFIDCADQGLDDNALVLVNGLPGDRLINSTPCVDVNNPVGCQMFPNDKTDTQNNLAVTSDYAVQLKDDGKALYGWGTIHKRPNDVRMYVNLDLPPEWYEEGADYIVNDAKLVITHLITNNPNDQVRPEDLENEAATGRKPSYKIEEDGQWKSLVPCYEGDGDIIDTEDGIIDPTFIGVGTVLKNPEFAFLGYSGDANLPHDLYAFSEDLKEGFTNAWYTTLNRDPFEWSYDTNPDPNVQDYVGSPLPDDTLGELVSGPRWRLKPNKFGQDLPGLEIPLFECSQPPFQNDNIKYRVGEPTTTVLNLLDWDESENGPSPLATSRGWIDVTQNEFVEADCSTGTCVSSNGLPMTEGFDLAVYIKGDRKPTAIYTVQLLIDYEGEPPVGLAEVTITSLKVPSKVRPGDVRRTSLTIANAANAQAVAAGEVVIENNVQGEVYRASYAGLGVADKEKFNFDWIAPETLGDVTWTATVYVDEVESDSLTGLVTTVR